MAQRQWRFEHRTGTCCVVYLIYASGNGDQVNFPVHKMNKPFLVTKVIMVYQRYLPAMAMIVDQMPPRHQLPACQPIIHSRLEEHYIEHYRISRDKNEENS